MTADDLAPRPAPKVPPAAGHELKPFPAPARITYLEALILLVLLLAVSVGVWKTLEEYAATGDAQGSAARF